MSSANQLRRTIFVACRELGLDEDARQAMQMHACGKASMRDMGLRDFEQVINHLKDRGWQPAHNRPVKGAFKAAAPRADLRFIHVMWRLLGEANALRDPRREGLNAFVRSRFEGVWSSVPLDIDMLRDPDQIDAVVQALKQWCNRAGVELRR